MPVATNHNANHAATLDLFTTTRDFNEFLDVGSTPELEKTKIALRDRIAALPNNVRTTLKDVLQERLSQIRQELSMR